MTPAWWLDLGVISHLNLLGPVKRPCASARLIVRASMRDGEKVHFHKIVEIVNFVLLRRRVLGFREFEGPNEIHGIDLLQDLR